MNPHQEQLVRTTFAQIEPFADHVAALFYDRLFENAPEVARSSSATYGPARHEADAD